MSNRCCRCPSDDLHRPGCRVCPRRVRAAGHGRRELPKSSQGRCGLIDAACYSLPAHLQRGLLHLHRPGLDVADMALRNASEAFTTWVATRWPCPPCAPLAWPLPTTDVVLGFVRASPKSRSSSEWPPHDSLTDPAAGLIIRPGLFGVRPQQEQVPHQVGSSGTLEI